MIPVFQDRFDYGFGNCAWACIASILEQPLEDVQGGRRPPSIADLIEWTAEYVPELSFNSLDLCYNFRPVNGYPDVPELGTERWTYDIHKDWEPPDASATDGYWIASVPSQTLKRPVEDPYFPMPSLHAVVMHGRYCVHDPNSYNRIDPEPQVSMQYWWTLN